MIAPLQRTSYYFCLSVVLLQLLLFLSGSWSLALVQLPRPSARTRAERTGRCSGVSGRVLGAVGKGPGQSSRLRIGRGGDAPPVPSPAAAGARHSWCISGSVPRAPGNQKYLLEREARGVSGIYPAPSDEAVARESLSHQSQARLHPVLRCEQRDLRGGNVPLSGSGRAVGCSEPRGHLISLQNYHKSQSYSINIWLLNDIKCHSLTGDSVISEMKARSCHNLVFSDPSFLAECPEENAKFRINEPATPVIY